MRAGDVLTALAGPFVTALVGPILTALVGLILTALVGLALGARAACAQEFEAPAPAGAGGAAALIERALPAPAVGAELETIAVRWAGLADFSTRALALGTSFGPARVAAGFASTGDPEIGWNSVALAAGLTGETWGAGIRGIARRDRSAAPGERAPAIGAAIGAGFWSAPAPGMEVWAAVPTLESAGEAPPLDRGLETGVVMRSRGVAGWLGWSAPARAADAGERSTGAAVELGAFSAWLEARDRPLRATFGIAARRGALEISAATSEHPVLGETIRLALAIRSAVRERP